MSNRTKSWLILILLALIWGSSFILMKKGMFTSSGEAIFNDTQVGALRMVIASVVLLPFAIRAISILKDWRIAIRLAIVGVCGNFLPAFLFTYAETGISSGYAGMLNSCTPIFAILIGFFVFRDRLNAMQISGVTIGTIGVVLLMLAGQSLSITGSWTHVAAVVVATLCYGISVNTIKHTLSDVKSVDLASLAFFIISGPSIIIAIQQGAFTTLQTNEFAWQGLMYIGILSIVGTAFALILFNRLIAVASIVFASSVTYLIPVVAVIIGLSFGENINGWQIAAMCVTIVGVFIANAGKLRT